MKRISFLFVGIAILAGVVGFAGTESKPAAAQEAAPIFVTQNSSGIPRLEVYLGGPRSRRT